MKNMGRPVWSRGIFLSEIGDGLHNDVVMCCVGCSLVRHFDEMCQCDLDYLALLLEQQENRHPEEGGHHVFAMTPSYPTGRCLCGLVYRSSDYLEVLTWSAMGPIRKVRTYPGDILVEIYPPSFMTDPTGPTYPLDMIEDSPFYGPWKKSEPEGNCSETGL